MKKLILTVTVVAMMMTMIVGCSNGERKETSKDVTKTSVESHVNEPVKETDEGDKLDNNSDGICDDIAINIEGVVTELDGNKVTLDTGIVFIITVDTVFETQNVGESAEIGNVIEVGNFIQGFTLGDPEAEEVIVDVISMNEKMQISAKIAINIEGFVVAIDENEITLDNGQKFIVNEETAFETQVEGDINSPMSNEVNDVFEIGNYVQGFTMDDLGQEVVVALVINNNGAL